MRPTTKSEVPIGTVLSGRYRISREIGRGGMAAVYEAEHVEIGKRVAVKVLDPSLAKNDTVIERFNREARAAASVESPNICEVFDVGRLDDGRPYMVMEMLNGESLYERMVREAQLKIADTVRIISQAGRGLARAHAAGIVHRDLKPENIFLHRTAEGEEIVKLLDFGLAKFHTPVSAVEQRLTREGTIVGTPLYMSPEQVSGQGYADHRSDLWALGCIAYECLTGSPIWPVDRGMAYIFAQIVTQPIPVPSSHRPDLPRAFDTWFNRALQREPADRYQSAQEMVVDMATALGHDATGLVSAPMLVAGLPAERSPVVVHEGQGRVVVMNSRPMVETAGQEDSAHAPTEPPPLPRVAPPAQPASRKLIPAFIAAGVVLVGGVGTAAWFAFASPEAADVAASAASAAPNELPPAATAADAAPASASAAPAPLPAFASAIRSAQQMIAKGHAEAAVALLERSVERSDHPALLTMLDQARIAAAATGPCAVTGFGRPRPYDADTPARSALAMSQADGVLAGWIAGSDAPHAHAIRLDLQLAPIRDAVDATHDLEYVNGAALVTDGTAPALLFTESEGAQRGLWLQLLSPSGTTVGERVRLASHPGARSEPSGAAGPDGLWIAYGAPASGRTVDLFLRHRTQRKLSEPIRISSHGEPDSADGR
ncbi:MAG: serine/threonine-protein kinase, partial [Myxococcota bacterium]